MSVEHFHPSLHNTQSTTICLRYRNDGWQSYTPSHIFADASSLEYISGFDYLTMLSFILTTVSWSIPASIRYRTASSYVTCILLIRCSKRWRIFLHLWELLPDLVMVVSYALISETRFSPCCLPSQRGDILVGCKTCFLRQASFILNMTKTSTRNLSCFITAARLPSQPLNDATDRWKHFENSNLQERWLEIASVTCWILGCRKYCWRHSLTGPLHLTVLSILDADL